VNTDSSQEESKHKWLHLTESKHFPYLLNSLVFITFNRAPENYWGAVYCSDSPPPKKAITTCINVNQHIFYMDLREIPKQGSRSTYLKHLYLHSSQWKIIRISHARWSGPLNWPTVDHAAVVSEEEGWNTMSWQLQRPILTTGSTLSEPLYRSSQLPSFLSLSVSVSHCWYNKLPQVL
jgi:hypothetical protein